MNLSHTLIEHVSVFGHLCKRYPVSKRDTVTMWDEYGRFHLWEAYFKETEQDKALEFSDELRKNVLYLLGNITKI